MTQWTWGGPYPPPAPGTRAYFHKWDGELPQSLQGEYNAGVVVEHPDNIGPRHVTLKIRGNLLFCNTDDIMFERKD